MFIVFHFNVRHCNLRWVTFTSRYLDDVSWSTFTDWEVRNVHCTGPTHSQNPVNCCTRVKKWPLNQSDKTMCVQEWTQSKVKTTHCNEPKGILTYAVGVCTIQNGFFRLFSCSLQAKTIFHRALCNRSCKSVLYLYDNGNAIKWENCGIYACKDEARVERKPQHSTKLLIHAPMTAKPTVVIG